MNLRKKQRKPKEKLDLFSFMAPIPLNEGEIKDYLTKLERSLTKVDVVESFGYRNLNDFGYLQIDPRFFSENSGESKKNLPEVIIMMGRFSDRDMIIESGGIELRINKTNGIPEVSIHADGVPYSSRNRRSIDHYSKRFVSLAKKRS